MPLSIAAAPSPLWYVNRAAGVVALLLLTLTTVLGILEVNRWSSRRWPRFIVDGLHRNASLWALAVLVIHILTTVLDSFTPISLKDAVIPFSSPYRPIWLGLGALAFDLLLAVALTSVLRRRLGHRSWRAVHWVAYACWPLAVLHGLGTGTDASQLWMLALTLLCLGFVVAACTWRIALGWPENIELRGSAAMLTVLLPVFGLIWLFAGPLSANWAKRAGTPGALLAAVHPAVVKAKASPKPTIRFPLTAHVSGPIQQTQLASGLEEVDLKMRMSGGANGPLDVRLIGQPLVDGGVGMTQSAVSLGPPIQPELFGGSITSLQGTRIQASVSNAGGQSVSLALDLSIDQASQTVAGTVHSLGVPTASRQ